MRICLSSVALVLALTGLLVFCYSALEAQTPGTLYATTGAAGQTLITIDPSTGAGTFVDSVGTLGPLTEIEFRSDGVLFGSTGNSTANIITIDPLTGDESLVGTHATGSVNGLEFDENDILLGSFLSGGTTDLVSVDQSTGQLTTIGPTGVSIISGLAFSPGGTLYAVGHGGGASSLYTINPTTGASTLVGSMGFDAVGALEFGPNGILFGGVGSFDANFAGYIIMIDTLTGAGTALGPTGYPGISGLSYVPAPTSIDSDMPAGIPNFYALRQNYPNPFNPTTHIKYSISRRQFVFLKVYDALGKEIAVLVNEQKQAGEYEVEFDGSRLASGLYFYRIQAGKFTQMKKMVLIK